LALGKLKDIRAVGPLIQAHKDEDCGYTYRRKSNPYIDIQPVKMG